MPASTARQSALATVAERTPRVFPRPVGPDGRPLPNTAYYGQSTFSRLMMRDRLPARVFERFIETIERGRPLDADLADAIASAALEWALERGVTHFCHWFHPMTGLTAEKHDAFLAFDNLRPVSRFSGAQLIQSEPDASSFPSGGMRSTFEARGYTAWDPTSPMFIVEGSNGATLCIPSVFVSYHGHALDKKTPLLRSMEAINRAALQLFSALGEEGVTRVVPTAGPEQEYFLVDRAFYKLRPDLVLCGRTLLGARPPKGQTLEDHYFGAIPTRVLAFMQELEVELYRLGVPAKTRHNEVAPAQFEVAVLYAEANIAADHNQLVMELIRKVAERHNFAAILHEKPFAGVNGSGKHLNWSMADNFGRNLLEPGATPGENLRFLAVLASVLLGVFRHGDVLRASIASHGNDFRLGANEAPPAIISVFLGEQLNQVCGAIARGEAASTQRSQGHLELGLSVLPNLARDTTDRNRTSPFAFTGNKFEFRAVGASMTVSFPATCVNLVVAEGLRQVAEWIRDGGGGEAATVAAIRRAIQESAPVCFEGNNYDPAWVEEAARRGLPHLRNTAEALEVLATPAVSELFNLHHVLSPAELASRYHVRVERYLTGLDIEADALRDIVDRIVLPAGVEERRVAATDLLQLREALGPEVDLSGEEAVLRELNDRINQLRAARRGLDQVLVEASSLHGQARANAYATGLMAAMGAVRAASDELEERVADARWPLPRYREMLFQNA